MSLFGQVKQGDILYVIEEEDKPARTLSTSDFMKLLEDGRIKDAAVVHKVQVMERYRVVTKKELVKLNGEDKKDGELQPV